MHHQYCGALKTSLLYDSNNDHNVNQYSEDDEGVDGGKTPSKWCDEYEMEVCRKQSVIL